VASVFEFSAAGVPSTGEVPSGLPSLAGPALRLRDVDGIFPLATGCLLLAYVESISAARTFAAKHGYTLDPQQEFLGIGAANLAAALSHGYPVAGGLSQTAGVTDHVRMNLEGQSGLPAGSLHHPVEDVPGERGTITFGCEHERRLRLLLLLQLWQRFVTATLMCCRPCFLRVTCIVAAWKSIASQVSSHISEARNPCRNGPDERDQVNVQLTERLDQHLGRGVVVADASHDEVLALGRLLRFAALCRGTGQSIHLSTLAAV
jgi:Sulfate permease family